MAECERVIKEIKVTEEEAEYLSKATQLDPKGHAQVSGSQQVSVS